MSPFASQDAGDASDAESSARVIQTSDGLDICTKLFAWLHVVVLQRPSLIPYLLPVVHLICRGEIIKLSAEKWRSCAPRR